MFFMLKKNLSPTVKKKDLVLVCRKKLVKKSKKIVTNEKTLVEKKISKSTRRGARIGFMCLDDCLRLTTTTVRKQIG